MKKIILNADEIVEVFVLREDKSDSLLRITISGRYITIMAPHALQRLEEMDVVQDFRKSYRVVDRD